MNNVKRPRLIGAAFLLGLVLALSVTGLIPTVLSQSQSSDAALSALTLSDVDFGTFASGSDLLHGKRRQSRDENHSHAHCEPLGSELHHKGRRR